MKKLETKTDNLVSRIRTTDISFKDLCGEIGENLRGFERELKAVKAEPENLFMDFCYFFSGIPKPPSLYELNQEFLKETNVTAIVNALEGVSTSTHGNHKDKLKTLGGILVAQIQQVLGTLEKSFPPRLVAPLSTAANLLHKHPLSRSDEKEKPKPEKGNGPSSENPGPGNKLI